MEHDPFLQNFQGFFFYWEALLNENNSYDLDSISTYMVNTFWNNAEQEKFHYVTEVYICLHARSKQIAM